VGVLLDATPRQPVDLVLGLTNREYMGVEEIGAWIIGRVVFAIVIFQILGVAAPWNPNLAPLIRLLAIAATPGSVELAVAVGTVLFEDF
jgi:hypothetical protein